MIFYFTGTGNSLQVARNMAENNGEQLVSIAELMRSGKQYFEFYLKNDEIIGFIYPVYAFAPPEIVLKFIEKLKFNNYNSNYIFSIVTFGGTVGNAMKILASCLKKRGLTLDSGFSIRMPNNYIIGFDVDSKKVEKEVLLAAEETMKNINKVIQARSKGAFQLKKGLLPGFLSTMVSYFFNAMGRSTRRFYAEDKCTGCGICEKVCGCNNIRVDTKPHWGGSCMQCMACINYCPVKAIQYGKSTVKKGRYTNPNVNVASLFNNQT